MSTPETVQVLAARGKRVVLLSPRGARVVGDQLPDGQHVLRLVQIGEDGLYDSRDRERPAVPGPVTITLDARYRRLLADGDLVVVAPAPVSAGGKEKNR